MCEIHTIYIYRSLYCLYSHSTPIGPPHSMPIYGHMQMSSLNSANPRRGIKPTLGIGQNQSRDHCSQPISDEYFKRGVAYICAATIFPLECIPILVVVIMAAFHRIFIQTVKGGMENDTTFKQLTPADLVLPASYDDHRLLV